jgi:hypothetical protein
MNIHTEVLEDQFVEVSPGTKYSISLKIKDVTPKDQVKSAVGVSTESGEFSQPIGKGSELKGKTVTTHVTVPVAFASPDATISISGTGFDADTQSLESFGAFSHVVFIKSVIYQ